MKSSTAINVTDDTLDVASGAASGGQFIMSDLQVYGAEWTTDDIAYDYANPQKLVTDNANSNVTLNDLHAWWHMSEGDGTIAFDSAPLIGKELVVNGDFATDSDWDIQTGAGWIIDDGKAVNDGTAGNLSQVIPVITGRVYEITITITDYVSGTVQVSAGGNPRNSFTANGTYTVTQTADANTTFYIIALSGFNGAISNVSLKEVFNIDGETYDGSSLGATYVDTQERIPQLGMMNWSKGSNLIEYSEDISEWSELSGAVVSFDSDIINPDGTLGCYKVTFDGTFKGRVEYNVAIDGTVVQSVYLRVASGTQAAKIGGASTSLGDVTVTDQWQRFSHSATYSATSTNPRVRCDDAAVIYVWGVQYESGTTASAYRRTDGTAVTDATLIASATDSQKDILGNAVRVKGSGFNLDGTGYAEVLDDNVFDIAAVSETEGDFSICGWAKWKYVQQPNLSTMNTIFSNGNTLGTTDTFSVNSRFDGSTNKVRAYVNQTHINSTTTYSVGEWFYFALTRKKNAYTNNITLYVSKIDSNGDWVVTSEDVGTNNNRCTNSNDKTIGWDGTINDRRYHERIDDIKFYDRELSLEEIEQNFNATKSGHNN